MYNQNPLTLDKILNITSNILDKINKLIPLYSKTKPVISNIISLKNTLKDNNILDKLKSNKTNNIVKEKKTKKDENKLSSSNPQFFL